MKAIGFFVPGPIDRPDALIELDLPKPELKPRDLLVRIKAVSVNPVDTKVRQRPNADPTTPRILGYDASGIVEEIGSEVELFAVGDEVFYAGDLTRPGTNAQFHAVDERIVGKKPRSLDWASAAALPLTSITAWEALFDRLDVLRPVPGANGLLIIGAAGGVGSIAIQLAKARTQLTVIATASRGETEDWVRSLGADYVIDHRAPLAEQIDALGLPPPGFVFSTTHTQDHLPEIIKLIAPQGRLALIDDPANLDVVPLKTKVISLHWEFMFARSMFQTADQLEQHRLLNLVSELVDTGQLRTTMTERRHPISAATLREAHQLIESERSRGKIVIEGWE